MKNKKPSFCYITPIEYLEQFATQSHTHLVLAHLVEQSDSYAQFYAARRQVGDFIIMDNSSYELKEPFLPEKLLVLAKKCGAHVIVLPDYPFQPAEKTIDAAIKYIPIFKDAGLRTFFVPQSKQGELNDWVAGYKWASDNIDIDIIGMSILGIPNAIPYCSPTFARVVMSQILIERGIFNFDKHHHYLGLNAGPALEIPSLIKMGALDTIDSSGPVFAALMGHRYTIDADSLQMVKKLKAPVNFYLPMTKDVDTINRIQHNIDLTNALFSDNYSSSVSTWYAEE